MTSPHPLEAGLSAAVERLKKKLVEPFFEGLVAVGEDDLRLILSALPHPDTSRGSSSEAERAQVPKEELDALRYVLNWADSTSRVRTVMATFTKPDLVTTEERLESLYRRLLASPAIDRGSSGGVEGFVLVPREPTEAMCWAWTRHLTPKGAWQAMLAAAPTTTEQPPEGGR